MLWLSKILDRVFSFRKGAEPEAIRPEEPEEAADAVTAWRLAVTMNVNTPSQWLLRHGETSDTPTDVPPEFGIWLPVTKGLSQTSDADQWPPGTMASQVGQIPQDGGDFLPLLIEYRRIVETPDKGLNALRLDALKDRFPNYASVLEPKLNRKQRKAARR